MHKTALSCKPQETQGLIEAFKENWLLRMKSDSFIMLVNKHTGYYENFYAYNKKTREIIKLIADNLDKHKKLEGDDE